MRKNLTILLSLLPLLLLAIPHLAFAAENSNPLNFTPPASDLSMVFLGNIFGVVDGVLAGTGSQILGQMFGVFNAAVLSLGGIVLIYILLVGTLNTASEGEALGKKWSSIWIPVRAAAGVALLIPKASGYCLMQIFVMWVVVQGVGAADKVWGAALGYLARGGTLVQTTNPVPSTSPMALAAGNILTSEVCMYGLQYILEQQRKTNQTSGTCTSGSDLWFCQPVPDFTQGIDFTKTNDPNAPAGSSQVDFPNFDSALYGNYAKYFNGKCGHVSWVNISAADVQSDIDKGGSGIAEGKVTEVTPVSSNDTGPAPPPKTVEAYSYSYLGDIVKQAIQARAIAMQQIYLNLNGVASSIVNNAFVTNPSLPLGYVVGTDKDLWSGGGNNAPLLNGTEIKDSVAAYNTLMNPTLRLLNGAIGKNAMKFIPEAYKNGWIMAGSYYFNLVGTNKKVQSRTDDAKNVTTDVSQATKVETNFGNNVSLNGLTLDATLVTQLGTLIGSDATQADPTTNKNCRNEASVLENYICNAISLNQPGQPGLVPPSFGVVDNPSFSALPPLGPAKIHGGWFDVPGSIMSFMYNDGIRFVLNLFIKAINIVLGIVMIPISTIFAMVLPVFTSGLTEALANHTNPIAVLAATGNHFINIGVLLWTAGLVGAGILGASAGPIEPSVAIGILLYLAPIVFLWLTVIMTTGIMMAYYIPLVPYILFTYGGLGWFIGVIEAMVAAPIVALGITHPEGHEAFGKSDQAIMLLLNVFLRPAMMVIGLIAGIILSYVGIWLLNTGFSRAVGLASSSVPTWHAPGGVGGDIVKSLSLNDFQAPGAGQSYSGTGGMMAHQTNFSALLGSIFIIVIYVIMYMQIVQKAFELINILPDKILRWLSGGFQESLGSEAGRMGQETGSSAQSGASQAGKTISKSAGGIQKQAEKKADMGAKEKKVNNEKDPEINEESTSETTTLTGGDQ